MISRLSSVARAGVIALAALSMMPMEAPAAPIGPTIMPAVVDGSVVKPIPVQYRPYRRGPRGGYYGRRYGPGIGPGVVLGLGILGAVIADSAIPYKPRYYGGSAHVDWCYARYRSYRASDNTFKPYNGPRRQCVSPY